jgi:general secretion pathway protein M
MNTPSPAAAATPGAPAWHARLRRVLAALLVAAIVLAPLAIVAAYVYQKHQNAQRMLDELQPRYARLLGLQQQAPALADAAQQAQAALDQRLYGPDADPGATANEALQRARTLLEEAGLGIEASQTSPAQDDGPLLQRIPLTLTAEGDMAAILAGLQKLHTATPAIRVVKLTLRPAGLAPPSSNPKLKLQLNLAVWRQKAS